MQRDDVHNGLQSMQVAALSTLIASLSTPGQPFRRVVVAAGTHGNEYTGVWVARRLEASDLARYPSLRVETLVANPRAHAENRRFVDHDLNRQFATASLAATDAPGYEPRRAKEISAALGPKGAWAGEAGDGVACDVLIDLHTTTANMGCTIIVPDYCAHALACAAYIAGRWADAADVAAAFPLRVLIEQGFSHADSPYLASVARQGMEIEVGPTPQGLLRADCVAATERAVELALEYFELAARRQAPPTPPTLAAFADRGKLRWPPGAGCLPGALVHPSLQGRDFEPLRAGEPLWLGADGQTIAYDGSAGGEVLPIFVNEAAYYNAESGAGIILCEAVTWRLEPACETAKQCEVDPFE